MADDLNCSFDSSAPWPPITSTQPWINAESTYFAPNPRLLSSTEEKSHSLAKLYHYQFIVLFLAWALYLSLDSSLFLKILSHHFYILLVDEGLW